MASANIFIISARMSLLGEHRGEAKLGLILGGGRKGGGAGGDGRADQELTTGCIDLHDFLPFVFSDGSGRPAADPPKAASHAGDVRLPASEQFECQGGLMDGHSLAVHGAAAASPGLGQQRRLQREVDDVGDPALRAEQCRIERDPRQLGHAHRRRVDQSVRLRGRLDEVRSRPDDRTREPGGKPGGQSIGFFTRDVGDQQMADTAVEQGMRHCGAGAACAEQENGIAPNVGHLLAEALLEPPHVGVVAGPAVRRAARPC